MTDPPSHREGDRGRARITHASRLVTNGEYLEFMDDGGYRRPELWLSMGWAAVQEHGWSEPFYWERDGVDYRFVSDEDFERIHETYFRRRFGYHFALDGLDGRAARITTSAGIAACNSSALVAVVYCSPL